MLDKTSPKLLIIGGISHSIALLKDGPQERFGGGVMYAGRTAAKLGVPTTVTAIGAEDIEPGIAELFSIGLMVKRVIRNSSNNFSNDYRGEVRKMFMRSYVEQPLNVHELPLNFQDFQGIMLYPIYHEITPDILKSTTPHQGVYLDVQGLIRELGERSAEGLYPVSYGHWETIDGYRGKVGILKLSEVDLGGIEFPAHVSSEEEKAQYLSNNGFPITILTRGEKSTLLARKNLPLVEIPIQKVKVLDLGGVGDMFGVAFMAEYLKTKDSIKAAAFGNACASFKVAGEDYDYERVKVRAEEILSSLPKP